MPVPETSARLAWLAGLVIGLCCGLLLFVFPILGLAALAIGVALILRYPPRAFGFGGLGIGLGGLWTWVLWQAASRCDAFNEVPGQSCVSPTIDGYLVAAVVVLAAGVLFTAAGLGRRRLRRSGESS